MELFTTKGPLTWLDTVRVSSSGDDRGQHNQSFAGHIVPLKHAAGVQFFPNAL